TGVQTCALPISCQHSFWSTWAVRKSDSRCQIVFVRSHRSRHTRRPDCRIGGAEETKRNCGVLIPDAQVQCEVLRDLQIVLCEIRLVPLSRVEEIGRASCRERGDMWAGRG